MLDQYKNIKQLTTARKSFSAERLPASKTQLFSVDSNQTYVPNTNILDNNIEFHIYSDTSYVTGKHKINFQDTIPEYKDKITNRNIQINTGIGIDLYKQFEDLQITAGNYNIVLNFFKNLIGNFDRQHLRIDEISPDRKEIRLRAIDDQDSEFLEQITNYIQTVNQTINSGLHRTYLLNFSRNQCVQFINSVVIGEYLYVKLQDPLPEQFKEDFKCWVVEELKPTYIDRVNILAAQIEKTFKQLSNPNWQANFSYNTSNETNLKSWTDLLGSSVQTSQQIVDYYFSGSLSGMKLNIDYSNFNNFIFYSSATERLENFKYKLELIEYYTSQSVVVSGISGSVATTNKSDFDTLKSNLIGGFDNFEQYLYYESSSKLTTHDIPIIDANVPSVTGSLYTIDPVPKLNSSKPYTLSETTSTTFKTWYNSLYTTAELYDTLNNNALIKAVPDHIQQNNLFVNISTFINMLAQHFDILYTYVDNMTQINSREENPKLGMPNELLYSVAKQFGWNLTNGNQYKDLWEYALGTNESGIPITGSNSVGDPSVTGKNMTYTVWRRIVNNLPLLLKSKGTKRSIQALLSCYGIPQSFISINEYGGPRLERAPIYEKLNFDYALDLIGNAAGTVTVNYSQSINTVQLRFRTADVIKTPTMPSTMNLFTIGSNTVTLDYTSGTLGTVQINGTGSGNIELFDGGYLTTMLRTNGNKLESVTKKSKHGKIVAAVSASATASFDFQSTLTLGGTTGGNRLQGQLQELRFWSSSLGDSAFDNHVSAPAAYDGNVDAYDELVFRLPLTQKINHATTSSLIGVEPNNSGISGSFASWTNNTPYDSIEEMYYYDAISLGAGTFDDNKIRLEDNELIGNLDVKTRAERSQFDKAPLDSKKLGVYFSPQTMIDEDIIAQLGFTSLDDLIGDPSDTDKKSYPALIQRATEYWKKYADKNDINAYINMFTLFDLSFFKQLDQLIPARTDNLTGMLIQPNILERSRDSILPTIERFSENYSASLQDMAPTASADSLQYTGSVENKIVTLTGNDDDQWQAYLTASVEEKYGGTTYSYDYLIRSGSTYITASTPYWRSEGELPVIISSSLSEFKQITIVLPSTYGGYSYGAGGYVTSQSLQMAQIQDYLPTGIENQKYAGSKLTSADFNIVSTQTVDGGAPVEIRKANPNQLVYQQQTNDNGSFRLT